MPEETTSRNTTMKTAGAILIAVCFIAGVAYYIQSSEAKRAEEAANVKPKPRPLPPVSVIRAKKQPIQAWLFAEGTVRAVRREYLSFDRAGRVIFVKAGADGGVLREGEKSRKGSYSPSWTRDNIKVISRLPKRQ